MYAYVCFVWLFASFSIVVCLYITFQFVTLNHRSHCDSSILLSLLSYCCHFFTIKERHSEAKNNIEY